MLYLIFGGIASIILSCIGAIKWNTDRKQKKSKGQQMIRAAEDTTIRNMSGGSLDIKNKKSNDKSSKKFNIKLNKYNKWLIILLLIFAMIITHYYKKLRGGLKDKQYIQQMKEKKASNLEQIKEKRSSNLKQVERKLQPYEPTIVFGG